MSKLLSCMVLAAAACATQAQTLPTSFPDAALGISADALRAKVAGKSFKSMLPNGNLAKLQYKDTGFVFLDMSNGFRDTGKWKFEGSNLCVEWQKSPSSGCTEARVAGDLIYVKRVNGDVMTLTPE